MQLAKPRYTTIIPLITLHLQMSEADTLRSRERRQVECYFLAPASHQSPPRWSRDVLATPQRASSPHTAPPQQWPLCHTSLCGKNKRSVINYLPSIHPATCFEYQAQVWHPSFPKFHQISLIFVTTWEKPG